MLILYKGGLIIHYFSRIFFSFARVQKPKRPQPVVSRLLEKSGGEGGIRTLDGAFGPHNFLAGSRFQPLSHLSIGIAARGILPIIAQAERCQAKAGKA
jgi:hypothetical protein